MLTHKHTFLATPCVPKTDASLGLSTGDTPPRGSHVMCLLWIYFPKLTDGRTDQVGAFAPDNSLPFEVGVLSAQSVAAPCPVSLFLLSQRLFPHHGERPRPEPLPPGFSRVLAGESPSPGTFQTHRSRSVVWNQSSPHP